MDSIAEIKERVSIVDLVERAGLTVTGNGRVRRTAEHPSLALYTDEGSWWWFSQGAGGDVFDWWMYHTRCDFRQALLDLAQMAGVELRPRTPEAEQEADEERKRAKILQLASQSYHNVLMHHPAARAAREYCHQRGWTDATLTAHRIGYVPLAAASVRDDVQPLSVVLNEAKLLDHPMAKAVLSIPADSLVYPHLVGGQCVYLSARGVSAKRHYNLPADVAGPKRLYRVEAWGEDTSPLQSAEARQEGVKDGTGITILVEGQADALSVAQWGFSALALCGLEPGATLHPADARALERISHVALDGDEAGKTKGLDVALGLGALIPVVSWPQTWGGRPVKDANDALCAGMTADVVDDLLADARPAVKQAAADARRLRGEKRKKLIERIGGAWRRLDEVDAADLEPGMAQAMGVGLSQFRRLMAAAKEKAETEDGEEASSRYETAAGGAFGDVVFEQCVKWGPTGEAKVGYAVRGADRKIEQRGTVDVGGVRYVPYPASIGLIAKKVVLFASEPLEYGSQKQLLGEIRQFIHAWLDVDAFYEQLAAYYVMLSWLYDCFETIPYLRALGDYGTGKSRFLQAVGSLCYRPMFVSGASSSSAIFRIIDAFNGTLIIDEADFANSDAENEIVKVLNVGYARGGVVLRSEKDEKSDSYFPSAKDVYGPKVVATRRLFTDRATESRCLTKRMTTARPRPGIPRVIGPEFWAGAELIRNKLLMWRLRNHRPVAIRHELSDASIEPRLDQVTLALKSIVDDPAMLEQINAFVRAYNGTLITDRQMSMPAVVVQVLAETWYRPQQTLTGPRRDWTIKTLAERAQGVLAELDPDEKMSPRRLGSVLSADLGLMRRTKDPETRRDSLVIDEGDLLALMGRYGIDIPEREA